MEQQVDEINKIIHIKCTTAEKIKFLEETKSYPLYDYTFNFLIDDKNMEV